MDAPDSPETGEATGRIEPETPTDGLWSRLRLIEGQPLETRADAYSSLHDELARRLESVPKDASGISNAGTDPRPGSS